MVQSQVLSMTYLQSTFTTNLTRRMISLCRRKFGSVYLLYRVSLFLEKKKKTYSLVTGRGDSVVDFHKSFVQLVPPVLKNLTLLYKDSNLNNGQ